MRKFLVGAVAAAGLAMAGAAHADIYNLTVDHCTGGCGGLTSYGTITVTGTTTLDIKIDLVSGVFFNPNGNGIDTFGWDLTNNPLITVSGLPSGWGVNAQQTQGTNHEDGFGDFDYIVNLAQGQPSNLQHLEFFVTGAGVNAGNTLTFDSNLISNTKIFGEVDVIGRNGKTGAVGATFDDNIIIQSVPEPATWALMLLGFGGMGAILRHRRRQGLAAIA